MDKKKSYRSVLSDIEVRNDNNEEKYTIGGYFILFDDETELFDKYYEKIDRNAIKNIDDKDIRALFNHDNSKVLGRTKNKTLDIKIDDKGLYGEISINKDDFEALSIYQKVKRGDIDQCSFGFMINDEKIEQREDGTYHSTILDIDLFEISIVTFPAYANTSVSARHKSFEDSKKRQHDLWKKKMLERIK